MEPEQCISIYTIYHIYIYIYAILYQEEWAMAGYPSWQTHIRAAGEASEEAQGSCTGAACVPAGGRGCAAPRNAPRGGGAGPQVMELVELTALRGTLVGVPGASGLSVEQRKRLTIATELVSNPSIIFMCTPLPLRASLRSACLPAGREEKLVKPVAQ